MFVPFETEILWGERPSEAGTEFCPLEEVSEGFGGVIAQQTLLLWYRVIKKVWLKLCVLCLRSHGDVDYILKRGNKKM